MARVRLRENVLAVPDAPVLLRHLALRGSHAEIGRAIAELAVDRYGLRPEALLADGRFVRARRTYFERNYPIHLQRMRGVAAAFGLRPDDDRFDFSMLRVQSGDGVADVLRATATYAPPWATDLIADRSGRSFAYECCADGSAQQIIDGAAEPQVIGAPAARSSAKAEDLQRARWWRCVANQEHHSLEVRFGLTPKGLSEHTGGELHLSSEMADDGTFGQEGSSQIVAAI